MSSRENVWICVLLSEFLDFFLLSFFQNWQSTLSSPLCHFLQLDIKQLVQQLVVWSFIYVFQESCAMSFYTDYHPPL